MARTTIPGIDLEGERSACDGIVAWSADALLTFFLFENQRDRSALSRRLGERSIPTCAGPPDDCHRNDDQHQSWAHTFLLVDVELYGDTESHFASGKKEHL